MTLDWKLPNQLIPQGFDHYIYLEFFFEDG